MLTFYSNKAIEKSGFQASCPPKGEEFFLSSKASSTLLGCSQSKIYNPKSKGCGITLLHNLIAIGA
jgi:hypothetical protein